MNLLKTNLKFQTIIYFLTFTLILAWIGADNLYTGDSIVKLFQAKSFLFNGFSSEKLIYPAVDFDPNYDFYFFGNGMTLPFHGYLIGQYPLLFTFVLSIASIFVSDKMLAYSSLIFSALVFYFFASQFKITNRQKNLLAFCTPIFYMSFDLSEHALLLLMQIPFLVVYFTDSKSSKFLPALIFGFAAWLRLEVVIFAFCFYSLLLVINYKFNFSEFIKKEIYSILGFALALITIGSLFYFLYGHPLGTRYLLNSSGYINSLSQKFNIFIGLLFAGNMKFGFYLVSMYFFIISIYSLFNFKILNQQEKLLFLASFLFTILVGLISPFDAVRGWGSRFLFLSILPFSILFISISKKIRTDKRIWRWILNASIGWSGFATILGILLVFATAKHMGKMRNQLNGLTADLIVFSDEYTTPYFSLNFLTQKAVLVTNLEKYDKFKNKINESANINSFLYIFPKISDEIRSSFSDQSNEFYLSQSIHESMRKDFVEIETIDRKDFLIYRLSNKNLKSIGSK